MKWVLVLFIAGCSHITETKSLLCVGFCFGQQFYREVHQNEKVSPDPVFSPSH